MKYPNAQKGVTLLWVASLIGIVITALAFVGALISGIKLDSEAGKNAGLGIVGGASIAGLVLFILELVGLFQAKKDERAFHLSLMAILFGIIFGVISGIFNAFDNSVLKLISKFFDVASSIASLASLSFIFMGIMSLANQLGDAEMVKKGQRLLRIVWFVFALSILLSFIGAVLPSNIGDWVKIVVAIFAIISAILEVVATVLEFLYYSKAKEMLKK